ncbi:MAG: hypothetical protein H7Y38_20025 [Armatimonadetes bacterium]|nr:hypothetical protein [Armatimonadota bacterium]
MNDKPNENAPRPIAPLPPHKPLTDEQMAALVAAAGRRKNDRHYLDTWEDDVAEYRRQVQEEYERELDGEQVK